MQVSRNNQERIEKDENDKQRHLNQSQFSINHQSSRKHNSSIKNNHRN